MSNTDFYIVQSRKRGGATTAAFNPTQIAGIAGWYDVSDSLSRTLDTGRVTQLLDKSGNGRTANSVDAPNAPALQSSVQNGRDTLYFNGNANCYFNISSPLADLTNGYTAFVVVRHVTSSKTNTFGGNANFLLDWNESQDIYVNELNSGGNTNYVNYTPNKSDAASYHYLTGWSTYAAGGTGVNFDGVAMSLGASGSIGSTMTTVDRFGKSGTAVGTYYLGEIILYGAVVSSTNRSAVEAFLKAKWGL